MQLLAPGRIVIASTPYLCVWPRTVWFLPLLPAPEQQTDRQTLSEQHETEARRVKQLFLRVREGVQAKIQPTARAGSAGTRTDVMLADGPSRH